MPAESVGSFATGLPPSALPAGLSDPAEGAKGRILVAEDDEQVRRLMLERLRQDGYACEGVGTAQEVVEALGTGIYDLLITDVKMPGNDTLSFLQACQPGRPPVPVIVITGYPSVGTAVEAVRLSVVDYLVKPVQEDVLRQSVRVAMGKGRVLRSLRKARVDMRLWAEAMDRLEQSLVASEAAPGIRAVEPVFRQTMALLGQIVADLQATVGAAMRTGAGHRCLDVCEVIHCDKGRQYERALHQTVEVLMNTKNAFKSKELGELRKSLVQVLKQQGGC